MAIPAQRDKSRVVNRQQTKDNSKNSSAGTIKHLTDFKTWQLNHEIVLEIYKLTHKFPREEKFGLTDQIRRAAASVTANIAEGWGRYHFQDKIRFYYQSRGSNAELQNFLILTRDLNYLTGSEFQRIYGKTQEGFRALGGPIRAAERSKANY